MTIAELFQARRAGYTLEWIANKSGMSESTLSGFFRKHNVFPEEPIIPESRIKNAEELTTEIQRMYWEENLTMREIAEHFGVRPGRVQYWMMILGIPRRSRAEYNRLAYARGRTKPPRRPLTSEEARKMSQQRRSISRS